MGFTRHERLIYSRQKYSAQTHWLGDASPGKEDELAKAIARKIGPTQHRTWIKHSVRILVLEDDAWISAPNGMIRAWIERKFSAAIQDAVREVTGRDCSLVFSVDPQLLSNLRTRQLELQADCIIHDKPRRISVQGVEDPRQDLPGRFEKFVVGPPNRDAVNAVQDIASHCEQPSKLVVIHSASGLGKTHLLQAVANDLRRTLSESAWCYLSGYELLKWAVEGTRSRNTDARLRRLASARIILLDDVHLVAKKRTHQIQLEGLLDLPSTSSRHYVVTCDGGPKSALPFSGDLFRRFSRSKVIAIKTPDYGMRCELIRQFSRRMGRAELGEDDVDYIARNCFGSIRDLEGVVLKVLADRSGSLSPISIEPPSSSVAEHCERLRSMAASERIRQAVACYFGLEPAELLTSRKTRRTALARAIAIYLTRKRTGLSFPEIGRAMGNKSHSAIIMPYQRIETLLADDPVIETPIESGSERQNLLSIIKEIGGRIDETADVGRLHSSSFERSRTIDSVVGGRRRQSVEEASTQVVAPACLMTIYNGHRIEEREIEASEASVITEAKPNPGKSVTAPRTSVDDPSDFVFDRTCGQIGIRLRDGGRIWYQNRIPHVGSSVGIPLLLELCYRPGRLLTGKRLALKPELSSLARVSTLKARLWALRRAFRDTASAQFYFKSMPNPLRLGWNVQRTWIIISPLDSELSH
jgi:chromosomal replication initiator protein